MLQKPGLAPAAMSQFGSKASLHPQVTSTNALCLTQEGKWARLTQAYSIINSFKDHQAELIPFCLLLS